MNRRPLIAGIAFAVILVGAFASTTSLSARTSVGAPRHVPLIVDESLPGFHTRPRSIVISKGIAKFTTTVPEDAKGKHGIGIYGGAYKDVRGAHVKPGYMSSLTLKLKPGVYTVFDSYKSNRSRGYSVRVRVVEKAKRLRLPGLVCAKDGAFFNSIVRVSGVTCRSARTVGAKAERLWFDSGYTASNVRAEGFNCRIDLKSRYGFLVTCVNGDQRIRFSA